MLIPALAAYIVGLCVGSFLTVVAHRLPRGESFVGGRSHCVACGETIGARDNLPVVSWALLRGRARCCGVAISPRYPLTEFGVGVLYAAAVLRFGDDTAALVLTLGLFTCLAAITITDLELRIIPNRILAAAAVYALVAGVALNPGGEPERLIAATAAGTFLLIVALIYPRGMGMGDVKLVAVMGLFLGREVAPAVLIGIAAGALVGLGMIAVQGSSARKNAIPFGPFLALGGVIAALWGEPLIDAYLDTFA